MTSSDNPLRQQIEDRSWWRDRNIGAAAAAGVLILLASQAGTAGASNPVRGSLFLLAIVAGAYAFARVALTNLITHRRVGVELLVLIAAIIAVMAGNADEAAILAFFYALAKAVYLRFLAHAKSGLRAFTDALPTNATVLRQDRTTNIPAAQLAVKDIVVVAPGARLPTDGRIVSGFSTIVPSPVLGGGAQSNARRGDVVLAGSLNLDAELTLRATRTAGGSVLAHVVDFLGRALRSGGAEQRAVERYYLGPYSVLVLVAALAMAIVPPVSTGSAWASSFAYASAFIVAAASWALVASPRPPVVTALAAAARLGVFITGGRTLDQLAALRAVAIRASALTEVEPDITNIDISAAHMDIRSVIALAADVAHASGRTDLRPITSFARTMGIAPRLVDGTRALSGGTTARTQAGWVYIARPESVEVVNRLKPRSRETIARLRAQGRSVFVIGTDSEVWGFVAMRDKSREDATAAVRALRAHRLRRITMLGVDDARAAEHIISEISVDDICNRGDEAAKVRELVACYKKVAVIASGDAEDPALAEASVRIRLRATDVASAADTDDVLLLRDDLTAATRALDFARGSKRVIRQNLAISLLTQAVLVVGVVHAHWTLALVAVVNFVATLAVLANAYRFYQSLRGA